MAAINISILDKDKIEADKLFKEFGITTDMAVNMFIKESIKMQGLPFTPSLDVSNQRLIRALEESDVIMQELRDGKRQGYTDIESLFSALNH